MALMLGSKSCSVLLVQKIKFVCLFVYYTLMQYRFTMQCDYRMMQTGNPKRGVGKGTNNQNITSWFISEMHSKKETC